MIENHNIISELMAKVQELHNEINCMNDSRDFKDAESIRSRQSSHVPREPALFPLPIYPGEMLSRARDTKPDIWHTQGISGNVLASSLACSSSPYSRIFNAWDSSTAERIPTQASTGKPLTGMNDRDKDPIPTPRFLRSYSAGNSLYLVEGRNFKNYGVNQQKLQISEPHF